MDVLVEVSHDEDLLIVPHRLTAEELLGLLECCFMLHNFVGLCVEDKAIRYPAVVASED